VSGKGKKLTSLRQRGRKKQKKLLARTIEALFRCRGGENREEKGEGGLAGSVCWWNAGRKCGGQRPPYVAGGRLNTTRPKTTTIKKKNKDNKKSVGVVYRETGDMEKSGKTKRKWASLSSH